MTSLGKQCCRQTDPLKWFISRYYWLTWPMVQPRKIRFINVYDRKNMSWIYHLTMWWQQVTKYKCRRKEKNLGSDASVAVDLHVLVRDKNNKQTQEMVYQQKQRLTKCLNSVCCPASTWHPTTHGELELDIGHSNKSIVSTDPWGDQFAPPSLRPFSRVE